MPPAAKSNLFLALNLGNTNLGCAFFERERVLLHRRVPVAPLKQGWDRDLPAEMLEAVGVSLLAGVNPPRTAEVVESLSRRLGSPPRVLGSDVPIPVVARVDNPREVGADRLMNVLAAYDRLHSAALVVDFGTALTIDVCSEAGEYLGGIIAPGLRTAAVALHSRTALLPQVDITPPEKVTGRNTVDCIRSGVFWGAVAMLEGLIPRLRREHPEATKVLATGGDAAAVARVTRVIDEVVDDLTVQGIRLAAEAAGLLR